MVFSLFLTEKKEYCECLCVKAGPVFGAASRSDATIAPTYGKLILFDETGGGPCGCTTERGPDGRGMQSVYVMDAYSSHL